MTDYIEITDAEIGPEQPLIESLYYRLRDNPIAITEGAVATGGSPDSPRVQSDALEQSAGLQAVTTATIRDSAFTADKIAPKAVTEDKLADHLLAKLVTNGGSHDHAGDYSLTANSLQDETLYGKKFRLLCTSPGQNGKATLSGSANVLLTSGFWNIVMYNNPFDIIVEIYVSGTWRGTGNPRGGIWSDGNNVRLRNTSGSSRAYYYQQVI